MSFALGQKIVCIKEEWRQNFPPFLDLAALTLPRKGRLYHIREFVTPIYAMRTYLRLNEITDSVLTEVGPQEPAFAADHFRPVVERKTDISVFERLLTPHPKVIAEREFVPEPQPNCRCIYDGLWS